MAFKFPKYIHFSRMTTKARLLLVVGAIVLVGGTLYYVAQFLGGAAKSASTVASAPTDLKSVPGGTLSPEYYRALQESNAQKTTQAKISGASAVPTLIKVSGESTGFPQKGEQGCSNCCFVCPGDDSDMTASIDRLVSEAKISQELASQLISIEKANVSVNEYEATLDELIRKEKITAKDARCLFLEYRKLYENRLIKSAAQMIDTLIKNGQLSLDPGNQVLDFLKNNPSAADLATYLERLVKEGKLSPEVAARLLAEYRQRHAQQLEDEAAAQLSQMVKGGLLSQDTANTLLSLQRSKVSCDIYDAEIKRLISQGKLAPELAKRLVAQCHGNKAFKGLDQISEEAQRMCLASLNTLMTNAKLPKKTIDGVLALQEKRLSPDAYQEALQQLVQAGELSPALMDQLSSLCKKEDARQAAMDRLRALQESSASLEAYGKALKELVDAGILTAEEAARLFNEYQAISAVGTLNIPTGVDTNIPGGKDFAELQQRLLQQKSGSKTATAFVPSGPPVNLEAQKAAAQALESMMSTQAQSLLAAWKPSTQQLQGNAVLANEEENKKSEKVVADQATQVAAEAAKKQVAVKAGDILYAVLDTAVDSDYPTTPVMATIVSGTFKGARLLGQLSFDQTKERVTLNFNLISKESWPDAKTISAVAIDPDTARTVLATNVDRHYLQRYGALFASSFISGYAQGISQAGGTEITNQGVTTVTHPPLSPRERIAVGIGQVGTDVSKRVSGLTNTPPTVQVAAGVSIGVLFTAALTV